MEEDYLALDLLIESVLEKHRMNRQLSIEKADTEYIDFSDDEIIAMVKALWVDRYTVSRKKFEESVGHVVSERMGQK